MDTLNEEEAVFLDAVLSPNRSLSDLAYVVVMVTAMALSVVGGLFFLSLGAYPIFGFFGLDAALIAGAFWLSRRHQRQQTHIRVTRHSVDLHHDDGRGGQKSATLPTAFARVELERPVQPTSWLRLCLSDKTFVIGRFLTPDEREAFADALESAIRRARIGVAV